jgi:spoIIIJ-associated protein
MEWVQTTGRTVEEALERALDELHVHVEDVEYEVLEQPKSGFLGRFGGSDALVRVRLKPVSREKPQDRRRGKTKGRRGRSDRDQGDRPRSGGKSKPAKEKAARPERTDRPEKSEKPAKPVRAPKPEAEESSRMSDDETMPIGEQADAAEEFVNGLIEAMGLSADVTSRVLDDDDVVEVEVEGSELGLLVGPKGATLQALEELTRAAVQRETGGQAARIRVDVAGYKAKRRAALSGFTRKVVDEVLETGEARALEPMGSADRKTVHDTVNDIDGVETTSEGEDPRRYVVIRPA